MKKYKTQEIADIIGIHANTVRKYEEWEFITKPKREKNGYRIYNELHIYQFQFARLALRCEIVENGLRKKAVTLIKILASGDIEHAIELNKEYISSILIEEKNALQAIDDVENILNHIIVENDTIYSKQQVLSILNITGDTLRNWERNGLLTTNRKKNGYKIYTDTDLKVINIIKTLRLANYSLSSILRMLHRLELENKIDIKEVINNPEENEDIISVCDRLLTSLQEVKDDANEMFRILNIIKTKF